MNKEARTALYDPSIEGKRVTAIRGLGNEEEGHLKKNDFYTAGQLIDLFEELLLEEKTKEEIWISYYTMAKDWQLTDENLRLSYNHLLELATSKIDSKKQYDESIEEEPIESVPGLGKHTSQQLLEKYGIFQVGHLIYLFEKMLNSEKNTNAEIKEMYKGKITSHLQHKIREKDVATSFRFFMDKAKKKIECRAKAGFYEKKHETDDEDENENGPAAKRLKLFEDPATIREQYLNTLECPICLEHKPNTLWVMRCKHHICKDCYNSLVYEQWKAPQNTVQPFKCEKCQAPVKKTPFKFAAPF